jgi:hypothetical protein
MKKNKIIFLILAIAFLLGMVFIGLDISKRTTFPGSKGNLKERISPSDSIPAK